MHGLEIADHHRKRVRPGDAADDVMRVLDAAHPVAHRFVGASFSVLLPLLTSMTFAPISFMRKTLRLCRRTSSAPM